MTIRIQICRYPLPLLAFALLVAVQVAPIPIEYGDTVDGAITDEVPGVEYTFMGSAGDAVTIVMQAAGDSDLDAKVYLFDMTGRELAANDDHNSSFPLPRRTDAAIASYTLPADATYTILASHFADTAGPYMLALNLSDRLRTPRLVLSAADQASAPASGWETVWEIARPVGSGAESFGELGGAAVASDGTIYVADADNGIWAIGRAGNVVDLFLPPSFLSRFTDVAVGPDGNIYAASPWESVVHVYAPTGALLRRIGAEGVGTGRFGLLSPRYIAISGDGVLYASDIDQFGGREFPLIERFDLNGIALGPWRLDELMPDYIASALGYPLAVDPDGNLVVARLAEQLLVVAPDGSRIEGSLSAPGVRDALDVALDAEGNVYLAADGLQGVTRSGVPWSAPETAPLAGVVVTPAGEVVLVEYTPGASEVRVAAVRFSDAATGGTGGMASLPSATATVNVDRLNVRSGPSTETDVLTLVTRGAALSVTGRNAAGDWLKIVTPDGAAGWVFGELVLLDGDVMSLPVAE